MSNTQTKVYTREDFVRWGLQGKEKAQKTISKKKFKNWGKLGQKAKKAIKKAT